jgi:hypothetical protein
VACSRESMPLPDTNAYEFARRVARTRSP